LTGGSWILLAIFLWWLVLLGVNLHVH